MRKGIGWSRNEGPLNDNSQADLLSLVSFSLFSGKHSTTYKYCFLKSILENIYSLDEGLSISFKQIGETFSSVYWNMICVYKIPQMHFYSTRTKSMYEKIIECMIADKPYLDGVHYESINDIDREYFLKKAIPEFEKNVIGAFYEDVDGMIYGFSKKTKRIWFNDKSVEFLGNNKIILDQVNYYEWLKMVETILRTNNKKIDNLSTILEEITKRSDLTPFKNKLLSLGEVKECFYTGEKLGKSVHLDHVIPWDYLKSDNLWNFVFACPCCNSSKNNKMPDLEFIDKLIERNKKLGIPSPDIKKVYASALKNGFKGGWKPKEA